MGGSKSDSQSTVSANPLVENYAFGNMVRANQLYDQTPNTPGYYGGDTVADMNRMQQGAYGAMYDRGMNGSPTDQGLQQYIMSQLGQNYAGGAQGGANQLLGGLGQGQAALGALANGGMDLQGAQQFASGGQGPYDAALRQQASGAINPLTAQMYQQAAGNLGEQFRESVVPAINAQFAASGRTGSGLQADALGNAAGELADAQSGLAAQMFGNASESALQRQLQAGQFGSSNALAQRGLAADLYNQGQNRALGAAGQLQGGGIAGMQGMQGLAGLQQGAAGMAGLSSDLDYRNLGAAAQAGEAYQNQAQRETDADVARYQHESTRGLQDWERRQAALAGMAGIAAPLSGTGQTNTSQDKWSKWT